MGGKHEFWHKDAFRGGEFKFIEAIRKLMSESFQKGLSFSAHMIACRDKNVKYFSLQVHYLSHNTR